jgi:starvation-inducible outer membrane lipoprotein
MKKFKGISLKRVLAITIIASVGLLSGCAGAPGAIAVQDNVNLLTYEQLSKQIENTVVMDETLLNKKARWAGKIVSVQNNQEFSKLTISYYPSSANGRPNTNEQSSGQFVAIVQGYVEPRVFAKGRLVTVLGDTIEPLEHPSLFADGLYMWKDINQVRNDPANMIAIASDKRGHLNNPRSQSPFSRDEIGDNIQSSYEITDNNGDSQSIIVDESQDPR